MYSDDEDSRHDSRMAGNIRKRRKLQQWIWSGADRHAKVTDKSEAVTAQWAVEIYLARLYAVDAEAGQEWYNLEESREEEMILQAWKEARESITSNVGLIPHFNTAREVRYMLSL